MTRTITREQSRRLDSLAVEQYGMASVMLMENAGRGTTDVLCTLGIDGPVVVCAGSGNNGGDGYVIARHLDLRGHQVRVLLLAPPEKLKGDAATNYQILTKSGIAVRQVDAAELAGDLSGAAWVVDGLLGTGATGDPRPPLDAAIDAINASGSRVLAIDVPSGLDCESGQASEHTIRAEHTCTFVANKPGFVVPGADAYTGVVHVVDIGAPRKLVEEILTQTS
ncbi:MAG: NAD(P)H-hydrate epimerase [Planctomycetota bacterium]|nr:MAG: NAD(P)H-hydrate epimerase [Planctomycetota bacterium]